MPRKARIDAPGAMHHIITRGIDGSLIFRDQYDYNRFLDRLDVILTETETLCYAWALLPNHFHLLLKTCMTPIASVMRRLLTGHAVYFNHRHKRRGHLFQNRYKSILCQKETYLKELVRYIHLNPLRAGSVDDMITLNTYPYCGHSAVLGKIDRAWQKVDDVLAEFGKSQREALEEYQHFVANGINKGKRPELTGGGLLRSVGGWPALVAMRASSGQMKSDERILGDSNFVKEVLAYADEQNGSRFRLRSKGFTFEDVANRVAQVLAIPHEMVWEKSRRPKVVQARSLLCYWASQELGMKMTEIGKRLGLTQPAVSIASKRGRKVAKDKNISLFDK